MKKVILLIPLVVLLFTACRKTNDARSFALGVNLHETFDQDQVQVYIDDQPLLNSQATTNHSLGLAGSVSTTNTEGNHTIKVIVNNSTHTIEDFTQQSNLYIGISYDKAANKISLLYSLQPFVYD